MHLVRRWADEVIVKGYSEGLLPCSSVGVLHCSSVADITWNCFCRCNSCCMCQGALHRWLHLPCNRAHTLLPWQPQYQECLLFHHHFLSIKLSHHHSRELVGSSNLECSNVVVPQCHCCSTQWRHQLCSLVSSGHSSPPWPLVHLQLSLWLLLSGNWLSMISLLVLHTKLATDNYLKDLAQWCWIAEQALFSIVEMCQFSFRVFPMIFFSTRRVFFPWFM